MFAVTSCSVVQLLGALLGTLDDHMEPDEGE